MSDPTLQSRLDDAAREIERLASECAAQRAELVRLREELRTLRNCRTVGDDLGLKRHEWPEYRAESDSK